MKRLQIAAMVALLALGFWLAVGPAVMQSRIGATPGALVMRLEIGGRKVRAERVETPEGEARYRFLTHTPDLPQTSMDNATFWAALHEVARGTGPRHFLLDALNISSWWGVGWVAIGFLGQGAFFGRMLVQWVASERARRSIVPEAFWWLSLIGGATLFAYFVWRRDVVGVMGQSAGVVVYARNLVLIRRNGRAAAPEETPGGAAPGDRAMRAPGPAEADVVSQEPNPQAV